MRDRLLRLGLPFAIAPPSPVIPIAYYAISLRQHPKEIGFTEFCWKMVTVGSAAERDRSGSSAPLAFDLTASLSLYRVSAHLVDLVNRLSQRGSDHPQCSSCFA